MPLQRQRHLVRRHAATVIGHVDQVEPARRQPHGHRGRAGVQRVLHQFLERAGRPLHHLARGDAIDQVGRQPSY